MLGPSEAHIKKAIHLKFPEVLTTTTTKFGALGIFNAWCFGVSDLGFDDDSLRFKV